MYHAQHVPGWIDTLEERNGLASTLGDVVDDRDGVIEAAILNQRRTLQRPLRNRYLSDLLRELVQASPARLPSGQLDTACLLQSGIAEAEAGIHRLLDEILRELADVVGFLGAAGQAVLHDADNFIGHGRARAAFIDEHQDGGRNRGEERR